MNEIEFDKAFAALTGNPPFPWQRALYERFIAGDIPASCNLPTGLGKTSVVAVWLIALATHPGKMPRRLVYVVNRRTVVDQTTDEVEKYRRNRETAGVPKFAISTLRGQFADNREWSADPSRPAVICGTVDMIGSRLMFSGYGIGRGKRPLHAGFLGQDALLVHDEAHLEPAFQDLLIAIEKEQDTGERTGNLPWPKLRVMELSATPRGGGKVFELSDEEKNPPTAHPELSEEPESIEHVWQRLTAKKGVGFVGEKRTDVAKKIGALALRHKDSNKAVLVFVRTIDDVHSVQAVLTEKSKGVKSDQVQILTGTLRGLERDNLADTDPVFARFMPRPKCKTKDGAVYLVCTSAGEVGVDISADHMVSDLTPLDSMAQRLGRVNRRGGGAAEIDVVYETDPEPKKKDNPDEKARWATLPHLKGLPPCDWIGGDRHEASPREIGKLIRGLSNDARDAAFAPKPVILPVTDILFDAWALTTIRDKLPGRPKVEPYLHGIAGWEQPETHVAWREEVEKLLPKYDDNEDRDAREGDDRKALAKLAGELLDDIPLKPHELLREPSYRAFKHFEAMAKRCPNLPVWLLDDDGKVEVLTVADLADKDEKGRIEGVTVLLPPSAGGLERGMLNGSTAAPESPSLDVAEECFTADADRKPLRVRTSDKNDKRASGMRLVRTLELPANGGDDTEPELLFWFDRENEGGKSAKAAVEWHVHVGDVERVAANIMAPGRLTLPDDIRLAVILAAKFHDHGKKRKLFQMVLSNTEYPDVWLAKSGKKGGRITETYRHEFGSLLDVWDETEFNEAGDDVKELVLHLIAAHHGRGRPHFPQDEAFDPERKATEADAVAAEVPRRFARLQRKYGRWGLAYLESLLRAADWEASANPSKEVPS